jgi:hypothetical protein
MNNYIYTTRPKKSGFRGIKTYGKLLIASILLTALVIVGMSIVIMIRGGDVAPTSASIPQQKEVHLITIDEASKPLKDAKSLTDNFESDREYLASLTSRGDIERKLENRKEIIIKVMNKNLGGKLKNKGSVIYEASTHNKFPPYLQCSIVIHETGNGNSLAIKNKANVGGIFEGDHLKDYKGDIDRSIWDMAKRIKLYYIDEGRTTIEAFGKKYCPIGAKNDPKGLNKSWIPTVTKYYIKLINESEGVV